MEAVRVFSNFQRSSGDAVLGTLPALPVHPKDASFQAAPYYKYKEYLLRCVDQLHPGDIKAWNFVWKF